jgi:hypothetical protein
MGLSIVIKSLGANLTTLEMHKVLDININDIIISCTVLSLLEFRNCRTIHREILESSLAHFQNLKKLKFKNNRGTFVLSSILHMYVNLNEFYAVYSITL